MHIAQPALSRQIRLLEEELGVQLFERHPRGAAPTEAAVVLLDRATFILRYFEQLRSDVAATQRDPHGPVALGMSPGLALTLALPLYDEISSRFPDVQLQIVEDFTDTLHDRLLRGTIDLAILNGPRLERSNLVTKPLMEEQICLIGVANSPHLRRDAVDVHDLPGIPLVLAGVAKSGVREVVETAATKAGIKLEPKVEVQSLEVAKRIISQGILCTAHFAAPIKDDIDSGRFRAVPIKGMFLPRFIARASDRPPSRATAVLTRLVATAMATARGVNVVVEPFWRGPITPFDPILVERLRDAARTRGFRQRDMPTVIGHDAVYAARRVPSALLFVPCVGGISHNEAEEITRDRAAAGLQVLADAVLETAGLVR